MRGYPFWPAKAVRTVKDQVDCRFFGEHNRAWVSLSQVRLLHHSIELHCFLRTVLFWIAGVFNVEKDSRRKENHKRFWRGDVGAAYSHRKNQVFPITLQFTYISFIVPNVVLLSNCRHRFGSFEYAPVQTPFNPDDLSFRPSSRQSDEIGSNLSRDVSPEPAKIEDEMACAEAALVDVCKAKEQ